MPAYSRLARHAATRRLFGGPGTQGNVLRTRYATLRISYLHTANGATGVGGDFPPQSITSIGGKRRRGQPALRSACGLSHHPAVTRDAGFRSVEASIHSLPSNSGPRRPLRGTLRRRAATARVQYSTRRDDACGHVAHHLARKGKHRDDTGDTRGTDATMQCGAGQTAGASGGRRRAGGVQTHPSMGQHHPTGDCRAIPITAADRRGQPRAEDAGRSAGPDRARRGDGAMSRNDPMKGAGGHRKGARRPGQLR